MQLLGTVKDRPCQGGKIILFRSMYMLLHFYGTKRSVLQRTVRKKLTQQFRGRCDISRICPCFEQSLLQVYTGYAPFFVSAAFASTPVCCASRYLKKSVATCGNSA